MNKFTKAATVLKDYVNLRQVGRPKRLWETRGSRLPLRGVIRLWIDIGSVRSLMGRGGAVQRGEGRVRSAPRSGWVGMLPARKAHSPVGFESPMRCSEQD